MKRGRVKAKGGRSTQKENCKEEWREYHHKYDMDAAGGDCFRITVNY